MFLNLKIIKFECSFIKLVICINKLNINKLRFENGVVKGLI